MADVVFVLVTIAFFAAAAAFVHACDRIIGADGSAVAETETEPVAEVAA
jgi:hypothetical protein